MTDLPAEDQLRALVRQALADARISQAEVARQFGVSTKHLCTCSPAAPPSPSPGPKASSVSAAWTL
jgi:hypothetical protein